jgi:hypothetical protein
MLRLWLASYVGRKVRAKQHIQTGHNGAAKANLSNRAMSSQLRYAKNAITRLTKAASGQEIRERKPGHSHTPER